MCLILYCKSNHLHPIYQGVANQSSQNRIIHSHKRLDVPLLLSQNNPILFVLYAILFWKLLVSNDAERKNEYSIVFCAISWDDFTILFG